MHPRKYVGCVGSVPYCLGAAQLWRAVADHWSYNDSSHRRGQPVASISTTIKNWFITRNCCLLFCVLWKWAQGWSGLSMTQSLGDSYGDSWVAHGRSYTSSSPSRPRQCTPEESKAVCLALGWLQELPEGLPVTNRTAYGAPLRIFCQGYFP